MNIKETELPGIGKKYQLITDNHEKVVVVIHDNGNRDVYHYDPADFEESLSNVRFTDAEARQFASILGGMDYKPKALEAMTVDLNELVIEWHKVKSGSSIIGRTIGQLGIRQNYKINVIGIIHKDHSKQLNPGVDSTFQEGDTVIVSGERGDLKRIDQELFQ